MYAMKRVREGVSEEEGERGRGREGERYRREVEGVR